jgi:2-amino-4-hydroxy-6-hydroxymethyldihydropteridine diphosphokinase
MVEVTAGLGGNIEPRTHLKAALGYLTERFPDLVTSPVYESRAIGFTGANFLNLVVAFETEHPLEDLLAQMREIETTHRRDRSGSKVSSRTVDIDVLTYGKLVGDVEGLRLPREDITHYAHVLKPLSDLRPSALHPELGVSYAELWKKFPQKARQPLIRVPAL